MFIAMGGPMPTPERTSLDEIVSAAARLLETGGVAAVTMQAVATPADWKAWAMT